MSKGKSTHQVPRLCSYNIPICQIACGSKHAAFLTSKFLFISNFELASQLCYTMGDNS